MEVRERSFDTESQLHSIHSNAQVSDFEISVQCWFLEMLTQYGALFRTHVEANASGFVVKRTGRGPHLVCSFDHCRKTGLQKTKMRPLKISERTVPPDQMFIKPTLTQPVQQGGQKGG